MKIVKLLVNLALFTACIFTSGCYTINQGITYIGYLNQAVPLEKAAALEQVSRDFVYLVNDIRSFAVNELGLSESKNYTRYVRLDRNYLAAVVSASAKDSFRRHEWKFPVVGAMPYKGFFDIKDAQKERNKLEAKELDVWVRTVDAFSTLGWFRDPFYSYMQNYTAERLADLIIHELMHATVFIKGQVTFNEELAEFIGSEGARLYIESRYGAGSEEYKVMFASDDDNKKFVAFIQELIAELESLYSRRNGESTEEILTKKEQIITEAKNRFESEYDTIFSSERYRGFSSLPVNNAYLELYRMYHTPDNFYEELYSRSGSDLRAFISAAKTITKKGDPQRQQLENALMR